MAPIAFLVVFPVGFSERHKNLREARGKVISLRHNFLLVSEAKECDASASGIASDHTSSRMFFHTTADSLLLHRLSTVSERCGSRVNPRGYDCRERQVFSTLSIKLLASCKSIVSNRSARP